MSSACVLFPGYLSNIHRAGDTVIGVHCADYSKLQSQRKSRQPCHLNYSLEWLHTVNLIYVNDIVLITGPNYNAMAVYVEIRGS